MRARIDDNATCLTLYINGTLDKFTVIDLQPYVDRLIEDPTQKNVTIDLIELSLITVDGVSILVKMFKRLKAQERLMLTKIKPGSQPAAIFHSLRLDRALPNHC